jgi:hypothetical protein
MGLLICLPIECGGRNDFYRALRFDVRLM